MGLEISRRLQGVPPMGVRTEINTSEIPLLFKRFEGMVGKRHWTKRIANVKSEMRGNRLLRELLARENSVAFGLEKSDQLLSRYGIFPDGEISDPSMYEALTLVGQSLSIIDSVPAEEGLRFIRRLHGAFRNPPDMRALQLELSMATHFVKRGFEIEWPEMTKTASNDIWVPAIGPTGLNVECKSVSNDKGRKIHEREALEFYHLLEPKMLKISKTLKVGVSVVVTLDGRLPKQFSDRQRLANEVHSYLLSGRVSDDIEGVGFRVNEFSPHELGVKMVDGSPQVMRATVDRISNTENRSSLVIGGAAGGVLAITLQSRGDDSFLDSVFSTLIDSAKNQLVPDKAAFFMVGLYGITPPALQSLAEDDNSIGKTPSALRVKVSDFLSRLGQDHVVGVAFVSGQSMIEPEGGVVSAGGITYAFPKTESPFWSAAFARLFPF